MSIEKAKELLKKLDSALDGDWGGLLLIYDKKDHKTIKQAIVELSKSPEPPELARILRLIASQVPYFEFGGFDTKETANRLIQGADELDRLTTENEELKKKLNKLCELSCHEDITKECGKDFVCSMRINEITFIKAKNQLEVIDYIFNSIKERFYQLLNEDG